MSMPLILLTDPAGELQDECAAARTACAQFGLPSSDWPDGPRLAVLTTATLIGYRFGGSDRAYWRHLDQALDVQLDEAARETIATWFGDYERTDDAVTVPWLQAATTPAGTPWERACRRIARPIAHALVPMELHEPLVRILDDTPASAVHPNATAAAIGEYMRTAALWGVPARLRAFLLRPAEPVGGLIKAWLGWVRPQDRALLAPLTDRLKRDAPAATQAVFDRVQRRAPAQPLSGVAAQPVQVPPTEGALWFDLDPVAPCLRLDLTRWVAGHVDPALDSLLIQLGDRFAEMAELRSESAPIAKLDPFVGGSWANNDPFEVDPWKARKAPLPVSLSGGHPGALDSAPVAAVPAGFTVPTGFEANPATDLPVAAPEGWQLHRRNTVTTVHSSAPLLRVRLCGASPTVEALRRRALELRLHGPTCVTNVSIGIEGTGDAFRTALFRTVLPCRFPPSHSIWDGILDYASLTRGSDFVLCVRVDEVDVARFVLGAAWAPEVPADADRRTSCTSTPWEWGAANGWHLVQPFYAGRVISGAGLLEVRGRGLPDRPGLTPRSTNRTLVDVIPLLDSLAAWATARVHPAAVGSEAMFGAVVAAQAATSIGDALAIVLCGSDWLDRERALWDAESVFEADAQKISLELAERALSDPDHGSPYFCARIAADVMLESALDNWRCRTGPPVELERLRTSIEQRTNEAAIAHLRGLGNTPTQNDAPDAYLEDVEAEALRDLAETRWKAALPLLALVRPHALREVFCVPRRWEDATTAGVYTMLAAGLDEAADRNALRIALLVWAAPDLLRHEPQDQIDAALGVLLGKPGLARSARLAAKRIQKGVMLG